MADEKCNICKDQGRVRCEDCFSVGKKTVYCTRAHLDEDAHDHRMKCKAFEIVEDGELGRHIVAKRRIKQGEIIIVEKPLVSAPEEDIIPTCLTCDKVLDGSYSCTKCGWPMCNKRCEKNAIHKAECSVTAKDGIVRTIVNFKVKHPFYKYIGPLRCLYLKDNEPEKWQDITDLISHKRVRSMQGHHDIADELASRFDLKKYHRDEIRHVCGVWDIHHFCLAESNKRLLFGKTSLFSHSCIANAFKSFNTKEHIVIRACHDIRGGDVIYISYVNQTNGNLQRRGHLFHKRYFYCECKRCVDPTELGTHLSSLKCQSCRKGLITPPRKRMGPSWTCNNCKRTTDKQVISTTLKDLSEKAFKVKDTTSCQKFLDESKSTLSENHFLRVQVKTQYCLHFEATYMLFGSKPEDDQIMEKKQNLCRELIELSEVIQKGYSQFRGALFRVLQHVLVWQCGRLGAGIDSEKQAIFAELAVVREEVNAVFTKDTVGQRDVGIMEDSEMIAAMVLSQYKPEASAQ